jgi:hypothetical protein
MKKSSLFISAVLTTFILAVLAGAITAYRAFTRDTTQTVVSQAPVVLQPTTVTLTPEAAAQVAAQYLRRSDLYSVESAILNGVTAFKVTFSSGDVVYVGTDGQVVSVVPAQVVLIQNPAPTSQPVQSSSPSWNDDSEGGGGDD